MAISRFSCAEPVPCACFSRAWGLFRDFLALGLAVTQGILELKGISEIFLRVGASWGGRNNAEPVVLDWTFFLDWIFFSLGGGLLKLLLVARNFAGVSLGLARPHDVRFRPIPWPHGAILRVIHTYPHFLDCRGFDHIALFGLCTFTRPYTVIA